ncbi:MAG: hypothetical protein ABSF52_10830, partial [Syntrophobacteraceae bacterium]
WTVIIDRSGMESVENGGGRPARYALARRRVVIFFGRVLYKPVIASVEDDEFRARFPMAPVTDGLGKDKLTLARRSDGFHRSAPW